MRGDERVVLALAEAGIVIVPVIVIGELEAAFAQGERKGENRALLDSFVNEPFVRLAEVTRGVASRYGELVAVLRQAGTPIPVNDIWIAATSMDAGGTLLTLDHDFQRVPGLRCIVLDASSSSGRSPKTRTTRR
jgi:tRNA(fMet)-specific endonuclease VapC